MTNTKLPYFMTLKSIMLIFIVSLDNQNLPVEFLKCIMI